jgi:hypothetical protein
MQKVQSGVMAVHIILSPMTGTVLTAVRNLVSRLKVLPSQIVIESTGMQCAYREDRLAKK